MPKFAKGSKEAKDYMASLRAKRGAVKGKGMEGEGAFTKIFLDTATKVGTKAGEPFKNTVGVNPFTMGFDLGEKVIAPALMKRFPPKGRKTKGGRLPASETAGPSNRDLTPELVDNLPPMDATGRLAGSGMGYECCDRCGGMGLKKKTRM